jgi:hypothetical protein
MMLISSVPLTLERFGEGVLRSSSFSNNRLAALVGRAVICGLFCEGERL